MGRRFMNNTSIERGLRIFALQDGEMNPNSTYDEPHCWIIGAYYRYVRKSTIIIIDCGAMWTD